MFSKLLPIAGLLALSAVNVCAKFENTEEYVYIDFGDRKSSGWKGIENWKWELDNQSTVQMKGVPRTMEYSSARTAQPNNVLVIDLTKTHNATLKSPVLPKKEEVHRYSCLYFNYYIRVPNSQFNGLSLSTVSNSGYLRRLWARSSEDFDLWNVAAVSVDRSEDLSLLFEGNHTEGTIALSGLFLRDGICPDLPAIDCDFESEGLCHWQTNDHIYNIQTGTTKFFTQKPEDHTTDTLFGHTALFTAGSQNQGILISPIVSSFHRCLKFAFMANSRTVSLVVNKRNVRLNSEWDKIWGYDREYPSHQWHFIEIPTEVNDSSQFMIKINSFEDHTNAVQIDDIQLMPYCSRTPVTCRFDKGFCEWRSNKSDQQRWKLGTGRVLHQTPNRKLHDEAIYTDFSGSKDFSSMTIRSPSVDFFNFAKCAQLSFVVNNFTTGDRFVLDSVDRNDERTTLWSFDLDVYKLGFKYLAEKIPIRGKFFEYRLELVAESVFNPDMDVAVFSIELNNSNNLDDCVPLHQKTPKPETPKPVTPAPTPKPTPTPEPERKTKLDQSRLMLVNSLLNNVKTQIDNILKTIPEDDVLYTLVGDVDSRLVKAIKAAA